MEWTVPIVIHDEFGGFSLTPEMVQRLKKRGCKWADKCGTNHRKDQYWLPSDYDIGNEADNLRMDQDLVEVVRELTEEYKKIVDKKDEILSWREKADLQREMLANLKVIDVRIVIEIDDFDGKETVSVAGGAW